MVQHFFYVLIKTLVKAYNFSILYRTWNKWQILLDFLLILQEIKSPHTLSSCNKLRLWQSSSSWNRQLDHCCQTDRPGPGQWQVVQKCVENVVVSILPLRSGPNAKFSGQLSPLLLLTWYHTHIPFVIQPWSTAIQLFYDESVKVNWRKGKYYYDIARL